MLKIKSWPVFFEAIVKGLKKHDVRDMTEYDFKVGDILELQEYDPFKGAYTGRTVCVEITYITSHQTPCAFSSGGLDKKLCILSYELVL
jgi:uncharacterized protein YqfB (UPF0267 family)